MPSNFDSVFDAFIQNTFVHKSDLQLAAYENQTKGEFFSHLADKNIPTNTANLILQQLLNDVRKKSKEKIKVPISKKSLVEKKGIDVAQIGKKIDGNIKNSGNYAMTQEDELICPFCGTIYSNGINEQLNITSDYAHCENLIAELKSSISVATKELEELKNKYNDVSVEIQSIEQKVQNTQELLSYSSFYKSKGQFEIYESCKRQLDVLQGEINSCVSKIAIRKLLTMALKYDIIYITQ